MDFSLIIILCVTLAMVISLIKEIMSPGLILLMVASIYMLMGFISPSEFVSGFSNIGVITIAVIMIVSEGIRRSGAINSMVDTILPKKGYAYPILVAMVLSPIMVLSAFINNTPVVLIYGPALKKWSERIGLSYKKILIPLSYVTILGGMCTLVGTSTNLVVNGMLIQDGHEGLGMFETGKVGIFLCLVGMLYIALCGNRMLPSHFYSKDKKIKEVKEYYYDIIVPSGSKLAGTFIRRGVIRTLGNVKILRISRLDGTVIEVEDNRKRHKIYEGDRLLSLGVPAKFEQLLSSKMVELEGVDSNNPLFKNAQLKQYEVIVSPKYNGVGKTVKEYNFYSHFNAMVLAINKDGEHITSNIADEYIKPGDSLLILGTEKFMENWGASHFFYMVSPVGEVETRGEYKKRGLAIGILIFMILGASFGKYLPLDIGSSPILFFALISALIIMVFRLVPGNAYTGAINWDILIAIASALAISKAIVNTGGVATFVNYIVSFSIFNSPYMVLALLYVLTWLLTEAVTNSAAVAFMFPIAILLSQKLGIEYRPLVIIISIAASASFITPIGYQTNLIVQNTGNYKFTDFVRFGLPLNIIILIISVVLIPLFWAM
ncbi:MAG: SLC13 family permease [Bacteroidales bacterium]